MNLKVFISFNGRNYIITPNILPCLKVEAYDIEAAIKLFNTGVQSFIKDIQQIENVALTKLPSLIIKEVLSDNDIEIELDADAWAAYKKFLCKIEGTKVVSAKRKKDLLAKGNIIIQEKDTLYQHIWSGDIEIEDRLSGDILCQDLTDADPNNPFYDKKVVFTGVLQSLSRIEAATTLKTMGADINNTISRETDYVIVRENAGPAKLKKIQDCNAKGAHITILNEHEFLALLQ